MSSKVFYVGIGELDESKVGRCYEVVAVTTIKSSGIPISQNDSIGDVVAYVIGTIYPRIKGQTLLIRYKDISKTMITVPQSSFEILKVSDIPKLKVDESDKDGRQFLEVLYRR